MRSLRLTEVTRPESYFYWKLQLVWRSGLLTASQVLFLTHHSCLLVPCFSMLSLQSKFSIRLSPVAPFFKTFESSCLSHHTYVAGRRHWIAKRSPSWLIFLVTSEILLRAGSLPRLMPCSLMDTFCECLVKKRKWGGWPGRHCALCLTRKRFLRCLPWTFLFHSKRDGDEDQGQWCLWLGLMGFKTPDLPLQGVQFCSSFPRYWILPQRLQIQGQPAHF